MCFHFEFLEDKWDVEEDESDSEGDQSDGHLVSLN